MKSSSTNSFLNPDIDVLILSLSLGKDDEEAEDTTRLLSALHGSRKLKGNGM